MGGAREETQALNRLTVQTVGDLLGLKLPVRGMARCPFAGHDDSKPSFEVRSDGRRWICYGCDRRGGAIDLVMAVLGLEFLEAKRWLAESSHVSVDRRRPTAIRRRSESGPIPHPEPSEAPEAPPDQELYGALLARAPLLANGRAYLRSRRLEDTTIAVFGIGQMPDWKIIRELIRLYGFARVTAAGLLTQKSTSKQYHPIFPCGSLLFPYLEAGSVTYLQARLISDDPQVSRWRNLNYRRRRIYNVDVLARADVRRVAICEGAIDVLSAHQLGLQAIGLIGVSARLSNDQFVLLRGKQVSLLLDWDEAGEERARTMLKELGRYGVAATRKDRPLPGTNDVNDYLREVGEQYECV